MAPKYLYACQDGQLVRADVLISVYDLVVFPPPIRSGSVVEAMMSDDPNLTIEQFRNRTPDQTIHLAAG